MKLLLFGAVLAVALQSSSSQVTTIYPCPPFNLWRLPHSTACDKFIQCYAGVAIERDCGPGLMYDENTQECIPEELATCYRPQCPLYNDPENLVYIADYLECDKYYLCYDNEPQAHRCAAGLHWDEENEYCTSPAEANCRDYEINCRPDEIHQVPNPRFCNQFYYCLQGQSVPSTCPDGLLFDADRMICNYYADAVCYDGSLIP